MKTLLTLMHREWMQHRFGWTLLAFVPMGLALLALSFGQIKLEDGAIERGGDAFAGIVALSSIGATAAVTFAVLWVTAVMLMSGLPRRDHADHSIEFWLSLPTSHTVSLAAPLLMHLVVVPAAALLVGLAGGYVVSLVVVSRLAGLAAWVALPWADIFAVTLGMTARALVGLPLATLWLLPLVLLVMVATAWFRRWGWVVLVVGLGLGNLATQYWFGAPLINQVLAALLVHARDAFIASGAYASPANQPSELFLQLQSVPGWALRDLGHALRDLASPLLAGALLFAAACFALLVHWRQRGAGAAG